MKNLTVQEKFERNMKILGVSLEKKQWPNDEVRDRYGKKIWSPPLNRYLRRWDAKCYYEMPENTVIGSTWHNGATKGDAKALHDYGRDCCMDGTLNALKSWHLSVDESGCIQGGYLDRNTNHAGDGYNGDGNRRTVSIETGRDMIYGGNLYPRAEDNALRTNAAVLQAYGIMTADTKDGKGMFSHQHWMPGKPCPHRPLEEGRWNECVARVQKYIDQINAALKEESKPSKPKPKPDPKPDTPQIEKYLLQVRAKSTQQVRDIKAKAESLGFNGAFSYPTVQIGAFLSHEMAQKYKRKAEKLGIKDVEIIPIIK